MKSGTKLEVQDPPTFRVSDSIREVKQFTDSSGQNDSQEKASFPHWMHHQGQFYKLLQQTRLFRNKERFQSGGLISLRRQVFLTLNILLMTLLGVRPGSASLGKHMVKNHSIALYCMQR